MSAKDFRNKRMMYKVTNAQSKYYTSYFETLDEVRAYILTQVKHGNCSADYNAFDRNGVKVF